MPEFLEFGDRGNALDGDEGKLGVIAIEEVSSTENSSLILLHINPKRSKLLQIMIRSYG